MRTAVVEPPIVELTLSTPGIMRCAVQFYPTHIFLHKLKVTEQGKGAGSKALRELKQRGQRIELIAYPDNPDRCEDLERFYKRNGFRQAEGQDYMFWSP